MAIIIVDNFQVDINNPIDNRFVVGSQSIPSVGTYPTPFYAYRNDIVYKYPGLRIWDFNDNIPYVWNGITWINENTTGAVVFGSGTPNGTGNQDYLVKFMNNQTLLSKSNFFDNGTHVGLGLTGSAISPVGSTTNFPTMVNPTYGLHVKGNIKTNGYFVGKIVADYITDGLLNLERITPPGIPPSSGVYILKNTNGVGSGTSWDLAESIINTTAIVDDTTSPTNHYLTFVETIGHKQMKIDTSKLQFNPASGQLFLGNGNKNNPVYSFINSTETGIYYDGYDINFSKQGHNFVSIVDNGISIKSTNWPQISFINTTTNSNKLLWVAGDQLLYRLDANDVSTEKRVWHQDNLFTLKTLGDKNIETGRNLNISITNAGTNDLITGVYTYNVYGSTISTSSHNFWSILSFGKGDAGSIQLASNWYGSNATPLGNVVADRDILIRSLRDNSDSWSPWVKVWNSGNSGYVPFGAIMMWSGTITQIPTGWKLCDGNNGIAIPILPGSVPGQVSMTSITIPDLRNRFIIGATGSGTTTTITGSTTQTGGTKDAVVVDHTHTFGRTNDYTSGGNYTTNGFGLSGNIQTSGASNGVSGTNQNLPPYYALAFIIYTGI